MNNLSHFINKDNDCNKTEHAPSSTMKNNSLQEKYLIFRVKFYKDPEAYGKLYDVYVERIFRFVMFKVKKMEDAEDITAEVFLKSWQYIKESDRKIGNLNALLYRMARNAVIDFYREKRRTDLSLTDQEMFEQIMDDRDVAKEIEDKIAVETVEQYLEELKDEYRDVLILRHVEGFSIDETATIMQKSSSNIRVLLHRATKRLKELMNDHG